VDLLTRSWSRPIWMIMQATISSIYGIRTANSTLSHVPITQHSPPIRKLPIYVLLADRSFPFMLQHAAYAEVNIAQVLQHSAPSGLPHTCPGKQASNHVWALTCHRNPNLLSALLRSTSIKPIRGLNTLMQKTRFRCGVSAWTTVSK
jgi:hypothetical protein